jgi:predicted nucleotidyltransferase
MLQKCSIIKVADVFFDEPTKEHYLIEISRKSKIAHTSVKKHLSTLKKQSIINEHSEKKGKRDFPIYKADIGNKEYKFYKKIHNLTKLKTTGLIDFLKDNLMPGATILFGTYARGEDIEESDIDIFVMCEKEDIDLSNFEKQLNRKIQLHFKEDFKEYPKELKNNIINGIILEGYLEAF